MITQYPETSGYYFMFDRVFIVADHPGATEAMKKTPDVPVVNQKTLDLIEELIHAKATAEGKLALLKAVMETL